MTTFERLAEHDAAIDRLERRQKVHQAAIEELRMLHRALGELVAIGPSIMDSARRTTKRKRSGAHA
jgi:hypothetical protein